MNNGGEEVSHLNNFSGSGVEILIMAHVGSLRLYDWETILYLLKEAALVTHPDLPITPVNV